MWWPHAGQRPTVRQRANSDRPLRRLLWPARRLVTESLLSRATRPRSFRAARIPPIGVNPHSAARGPCSAAGTPIAVIDAARRGWVVPPIGSTRRRSIMRRGEGKPHLTARRSPHRARAARRVGITCVERSAQAGRVAHEAPSRLPSVAGSTTRCSTDRFDGRLRHRRRVDAVDGADRSLRCSAGGDARRQAVQAGSGGHG
jgi:hypothetical protein